MATKKPGLAKQLDAAKRKIRDLQSDLRLANIRAHDAEIAMEEAGYRMQDYEADARTAQAQLFAYQKSIRKLHGRLGDVVKLAEELQIPVRAAVVKHGDD